MNYITLENNTGVIADLRTTDRRWDGKKWVIAMVLEEIRTDPNVAAAIRGT